jgi:flagellar biosynthetic protein FliR
VEVQLPQIAAEQLAAYVLVLTRVGGLFVLAPIFSARALPAQAKVVCAAALALALTPLASRGQPIPADVAGMTVLIVKEAIVGLAFAFALSAIVAAVQTAAGLIDTMSGLSYASLVDPFTSIQGGVFGQLYSLFVAVVLVVTGGDQIMIAGLAGTFDVVPLTATPSYDVLGQIALDTFAQVFVLGLEVAAPALIALVVVDAALALVARAAPQLNMFSVGLPAKLLVAVAVVMSSLPFVADHVRAELESTVAQTLSTLAG